MHLETKGGSKCQEHNRDAPMSTLPLSEIYVADEIFVVQPDEYQVANNEQDKCHKH